MNRGALAPPPPPDAALRRHFRRLEEVAGSAGDSRPGWLRLGVPVVAVAAALGSLYWNVSLRQQLTIQESSVGELGRQNQKLTRQLEDTSSELRAGNLLGGFPAQQVGRAPVVPGIPARTGAPPAVPSRALTQGQTAAASVAPGAAASSAPASQRPGAQGPAAAVSGYSAQASPAPAPSASAYPSRTASGVPAVPAAGGSTQATAEPQPRRTEDRSRETQVPLTGVSRPPAPTAGPTQTVARNVQPTTRTLAAAQPANVVTHPVYADPLAQNIANVFALQKHSRTKVSEFHVAEGSLTKPTPDLGFEVKKPDKKHGTFTLVVLAGRTHTDLKGVVNKPMLVARSNDGRSLQLTVLNIENNQIYGYLTETR